MNRHGFLLGWVIGPVCAWSLACSGTAPSRLTCPEGFSESTLPSDAPDVVEVVCENEGKKRGTALFLRGETVLITGEYQANRASGWWRRLDEQGEILSEGAMKDGKPTGKWTFPAGEYTWGSYEFEPHAWVAMPGSRRIAHTWAVEVLDADLETGAIALRIVEDIRTNEAVGESSITHFVPRKCGYPGLPSKTAGVNLRVLQAGSLDDPTEWRIYETAHNDEPCTTPATATRRLKDAKKGIRDAGLQVDGQVRRVTPTVDGKRGRFMVDGHDVVFEPIDKPTILDRMLSPVFEGPAVVYEQMYALSVDGVTVDQFRVQRPARFCAGAGHLAAESLLVQGDKAALVINNMASTCTDEEFNTSVSQVFSLSTRSVVPL